MTETNDIRLRYERGIAACSKELISGQQNALTNALQHLLFASGSRRVFIWKNIIDSKQQLCARQTHELNSDDIRDKNVKPGITYLHYAVEAPNWKQQLGSGKSVVESVLSVKPPEDKLFQAYQIQMILLIPIFTGEHWYGTMGFENSTIDKSWEKPDVALLKTAADMVGSYVEKEFYISALIKSEERYRSIIENMNEGYFEVDLQGRFTFVNQKFCRMHRRPRTELLGMSYKEITDPETASLMKRTYSTIYKTGIPHQMTDYQIMRKDGSMATHEHSVSLIEDSQGNKRGFRGIVRDAGKRLEQEEIQKKFNENCFEVQKLESIATLAGGLAHDFNNLLMGIQGNTSLIMVKCNPDQFLEEKIRNIERCVQSGSEITNKLLGFARGGKYEVKNLDLNEIADHVADLFGRTRKDIRILKNYQKDLSKILGDSGQLEQSFLNLFLNAGQAMPEGGQLIITTENYTVAEDLAFLHDADPGDYVRITLADTGVGMDEITMKRIFEPFFTTKEIGRGTGLGLASVYGIVKNHSGMITVESEKGKGTQFCMYFPASIKTEPKSQNNENVRNEYAGTILLVDDEKMVLDITIEILEELGYKVLPVQNGMDAIRTFKKYEQEIDLVIMDIVMPDMNGFETAKAIQDIGPQARFMYISGYPVDHEKNAGVSFDHNLFLKKPYRLMQLKEKIDQILELKPA